MHAPERFVNWMSGHIANDKKFGRQVFRYHPRSDEHSKTLCRLVFDDLLELSSPLKRHAVEGSIVGDINVRHTFANSKRKTLDLAIGTPLDSVDPQIDAPRVARQIEHLRISCEAKQCMTEHSKTKPRIFDELSSSHEIVHQGDTLAIAAGIVVVNIASTYASPTRQVSGDGPLVVTKHRQPRVAESMIDHLKGLVMRGKVGEVGFDAFAVVVIDCNNIGPCGLHTEVPAPQPGDPHHYETFLERITSAYAERFA